MWEVSKFNASFRSSSVFDQRLAGWRLVELELEAVRTSAGVFLFDVFCFDHFWASRSVFRRLVFRDSRPLTWSCLSGRKCVITGINAEGRVSGEFTVKGGVRIDCQNSGFKSPVFAPFGLRTSRRRLNLNSSQCVIGPSFGLEILY